MRIGKLRCIKARSDSFYLANGHGPSDSSSRSAALKMKMEKERYEKFESGFIPQEKILNILGIWPSNVNGLAPFARFLFAMVINISYIYSLSVEFYRQCVSVDEAMDAVILSIVCVTTALKLLINRMNWRHMRILVNSVMEDWSTVKDPRHQRVMTEYFQTGRTAFLALLYMCYASAPSIIIKTNSFDEILKQQIMKYLAGSTDSSNGTWTLNHMTVTTCVYGVMPFYLKIGVLMLQVMQLTIMTISQIGNDGWFFSLTMHLSGQFEVLQMNLEEMKFEEFDSHKKLGLLVARHCRLVMLAKYLKQSFSVIILLQLFTSTLIMCIEGFVFLVCLGTGDTLGTFKSVMLIFTMIIQLYLYAYAGDILESRAEGIANAAYKSSWYLLRGNAARDLTLMIHRGHLSCHVTAGKFVPMNGFTFKEALKASASYLSVLRVMMKT
ncbi:odorant receptor 10a-like [Osmia bicornis bicornis]|uniref:odorant receptor 10a-like n=1 Tax=Osmia bicornis bicornis TaxID=1437191 RepID=UPI0010F57FFE|nr:odorant receptor 10a-like [Osmia bicornis bicornis]